MVDYHPRLAERHLEAVLTAQPVAVVMGARQTGKSTLVRHAPALRGHDCRDTLVAGDLTSPR